MMDIRKALTRGIWLAVIGAALALAPMFCSSATASADSVDWDAVAQCESGGNWSTNTGNGHFGGLQFKPATWASHGGRGNPASASRGEQIQVAERVLATQGLKAWPKCGPRGVAASAAVWNNPGAPGSPLRPPRRVPPPVAPRCALAGSWASSTSRRCARRCSARWAAWLRSAELVSLRIEHGAVR